jgi:hypothetical protein
LLQWAPNQTHLGVAADIVGFLINRGGSIFGGTYTAVIAQPALMQQIPPPVNLADGGLHNTFFIPGRTPREELPARAT